MNSRTRSLTDCPGEMTIFNRPPFLIEGLFVVHDHPLYDISQNTGPQILASKICMNDEQPCFDNNKLGVTILSLSPLF